MLSIELVWGSEVPSGGSNSYKCVGGELGG